MLSSKTKRKLVEDKGTTNGDGKNEKDVSNDAESDYEFDEVILLILNMCFYLHRVTIFFRRTSLVRSRMQTVQMTRTLRQRANMNLTRLMT